MDSANSLGNEHYSQADFADEPHGILIISALPKSEDDGTPVATRHMQEAPMVSVVPVVFNEDTRVALSSPSTEGLQFPEIKPMWTQPNQLQIHMPNNVGVIITFRFRRMDFEVDNRLKALENLEAQVGNRLKALETLVANLESGKADKTAVNDALKGKANKSTDLAELKKQLADLKTELLAAVKKHADLSRRDGAHQN